MVDWFLQEFSTEQMAAGLELFIYGEIRSNNSVCCVFLFGISFNFAQFVNWMLWP